MATTATPATSYADRFGRVWDVRLTAAVVGRVRRELGVRLGRLARAEGGLTAFLFDDHERLGRFLWLLIEDQAEARGVSPEDFVAGFDGEVLGACVSAVLAAVAGFYPRSTAAALADRFFAAEAAAG